MIKQNRCFLTFFLIISEFKVSSNFFKEIFSFFRISNWERRWERKNPTPLCVYFILSISIKDFVRGKKNPQQKKKSNRNFELEIEHQTS